MELKIYPRLSTRSKRAILRTKTHWGKPYEYRPRIDLIKRLSRELNMPLSEIYNQILQEREFLTKLDLR